LSPYLRPVKGTFDVPVVPGAGVVHTELFIAAETALGLAGDNRDFDPAANLTRSRAFFTLDFEKGSGSFQINPSCASVISYCAAPLPLRDNSSVPVEEGPPPVQETPTNSFTTSIDGNSITVSGALTNSLLPGPSIDFSIQFDASEDGVEFSGTRNAFPSYEISNGSELVYTGRETNPARLFDISGMIEFSGRTQNR
jgi:hypothetical protein